MCDRSPRFEKSINSGVFAWGTGLAGIEKPGQLVNFITQMIEFEATTSIGSIAD
jgi:hypothetical protein